jgi:Rieske Fe-S protein
MALGRRKLLLVGGGVVCAHAIGCGGGNPPIILDVDIPVGKVASQVALNTLTPVPGKSVAIGRDSGGIYAMTLVCTHQNCDIGATGSVSFGGVFCSCHGSQFDNQGTVKLGPATQPLSHLAVTADAAGALTIHGQELVSPTTRLSA